MLKVLSITSIRSDFDLLSPLYDLFQDDSSIEFKLLVCGAHCSPSFGLTSRYIRDKQYPVLAEVESLVDGDSYSSRLKSAAVMLISSIDCIKNYNPNLIIVTGDREDCLMGSIIGSYLNIPVLHMYGGDHACDGHIDNPVRHAVSKLSTAHFVSHKKHKERLLSLGEEDKRIFQVGSISLDRFKNISRNKPCDYSIEEIDSSLSGEQKLALIIYHSLGDSVENSLSAVENMLMSLLSKGYKCAVLGTNSDPGHTDVIAKYNEIARSYPSKVLLLGTLTNDHFITLFDRCDLLIGNSSAGILEAASLKKPVINVGLRQSGRLSPPNVIFCQIHSSSILDAINKVETESFKEICAAVKNPYGDGFSAEKALSLIKSIDFPGLLRKTTDPLEVSIQ